MADPVARGVVRRIVTAIPAASEIEPLLRLAARMAEQCDAQVAAVLVHNEALLRLASLSVTRHLLAATAAAEPLTAQTLRLTMGAFGQRVRQNLDAIVGAAHGRWTLYTLGDETDAAFPVQIQAEDLLLISAQARIAETWFRTEASAEQAVAAFAIGGRGEAAHDVAVVHDGTAAGGRALETAILLARVQKGCCRVIVPKTLAKKTRQEIDALLAASDLPCHAVAVATAGLSDVTPVVRESGAGIVVLPAALLRQPDLMAALGRLASEAPAKP
ncbi:MAG: hypothetical protein KIT36_04115 [Alphaproteobacteria bacterium]|nr:hypothetical protein [Alphaproteobacteria bacterium]